MMRTALTAGFVLPAGAAMAHNQMTQPMPNQNHLQEQQNNSRGAVRQTL